MCISIHSHLVIFWISFSLLNHFYTHIFNKYQIKKDKIRLFYFFKSMYLLLTILYCYHNDFFVLSMFPYHCFHNWIVQFILFYTLDWNIASFDHYLSIFKWQLFVFLYIFICTYKYLQSASESKFLYNLFCWTFYTFWINERIRLLNFVLQFHYSNDLIDCAFRLLLLNFIISFGISSLVQLFSSWFLIKI